MDNQHRKIIGYRELSQADIDAMNKIKLHGEQLRMLIEELRVLPDLDHTWIYEAQQALKKGIMYATRAVAKPISF